MAYNKKSFLLYTDLIHTIEKLDDKTAGEFFKHLLRYVNDLDPKAPSFIIEILFEGVKQSLKRDLNKWEDNKNQKSYNAHLGNLKRYNPDLYTQVSEEKITLKEALEVAKARKATQNEEKLANVAVSVSDSVSVSVSDSVIKEKEKKGKEKPPFNFRKAMIDFGFKEDLIIEWMQVRKKKKAVNSETAFNGFKNQVLKTNLDINEVLKECVERSWSGFKSDWMSQQTKNKKSPTANISF